MNLQVGHDGTGYRRPLVRWADSCTRCPRSVTSADAKTSWVFLSDRHFEAWEDLFVSP